MDLETGPNDRRQILAKLTLAKQRNLAAQHIKEHDPVAHQAIKRMFKRGGSVFLKEEMPDPCKAVAEQGCQQEIPPVLRYNDKSKQRDDQSRANKVQAPTIDVGMLGQIIGIERFETFKAARIRRRGIRLRR